RPPLSRRQDRLDRRQGGHRLCDARRRGHLDAREDGLQPPSLRAPVRQRTARARRRRLRHHGAHGGRRRDLDGEPRLRGRESAGERHRHGRGARRRQPVRHQLRRRRPRVARGRVRRRPGEHRRGRDVAPADDPGGKHPVRRPLHRRQARLGRRSRFHHPRHGGRGRHLAAVARSDRGTLALRRLGAWQSGLDRRRIRNGAAVERRRDHLEDLAASHPAGCQLDSSRVTLHRYARLRRGLGRAGHAHRRHHDHAPALGCAGWETFMIRRSWVEAYLRFLLRNRLAVTLVIAAMTMFFAYQCSQIKIIANFIDFYPSASKITIFGRDIKIRDGHPYINIYNDFRRMFGSANVLTAILEVKNGDIYNPTTLQKLDQMTRWMTETKGVVPYQIASIAHPKMKSITTVEGAIQIREVFYPGVPKTQADADRVKFAVYSTKGIRGIYVSEDDTAALVNAGFWEEDLDVDYLWHRMNDLKSQVEDDNHTVYFTGCPWLQTSILRYVPEVRQVFLVTCAALTFLLWNYFRSWPGVWVPMFSGFLSCIWALGLVPLLGLNLDPLILVVPVFLSARALSHSVQSMDRYHEEY